MAVDLTDGQAHDVALYMDDWSGSTRSEQIQVTTTAGTVLDTRTISSFHTGVYLQWTITGDVVFKFTTLAGPNAVLNGLFFDPVASATSTATYVKTDAATSGNWIGAYGGQGYDALGYTADLPSYATVTPSGTTYLVQSSGTTQTYALENPATYPAPDPSANRVAATWYGTSFSVAVDLTDGQAHDVALYMDDWSGSTRSEQIQVTTTAGTVLDTRTISSFHTGVYLQWTITGDVVFKFTTLAGPNAVLNGLFFDPVASATSMATYVKTDAATSGNWIGAYGGQGYDALGYTADLPSYATVTPSGTTYLVQSSGTTQTYALENPATYPAPDPSANRVAATWYGTSFSVAVDLTDGQAHDVTLYMDDWGGNTRSEQIQVTTTTGTVLDTRTISSFHTGVYLQWTITGDVVFKFTTLAGPNAVLNGLFFDPVASATSTATYVKTDAATSGNWIGAYGGQGYDALGYTADLPSYATVTPSGTTYLVQSSGTTQTYALENPATYPAPDPSANRVAATWYGTTFSVAVDLTDGQAHDVTLYMDDWGGSTRSEQIQVTTTAGTVLDTRTISSFHTGVYLQWTITGDVVFKFTTLAGPNAVLNGLFFDAGSVSGSSIATASVASAPVTSASLSTPSVVRRSDPSTAAPFAADSGDLVAAAIGALDFGDGASATPMSASKARTESSQTVHDAALEQFSRGMRRFGSPS